MKRMSRDGQCQFPECGRPIKARRLCAAHYQQDWEGRPLQPLALFPPAEERFWSNVQKTDTCWNWTGTKRSVYGSLKVSGEAVYAHIFSYRLHGNVIPEGFEVDHQCRNQLCVNPDHLKAVTRKVNRENLVAYRNNSTGVRGVTQAGSKFVVTVHHNKVRYSGGRFDTLEEAERAAVALRNSLFTNNVQDWL